MSENIRDTDKAILRKAMDMVVKSPRSMADMQEDIRSFLRNAAVPERMTGTPSKDRAEAHKDVSLVAVAIEEAFGERCPDYAEGCPCCDVWAEYDKLRVGFAEGMKRAAEIARKKFDLRHHDKARFAGANIAAAILAEIQEAK